jgi:hypothetical protein
MSVRSLFAGAGFAACAALVFACGGTDAISVDGGDDSGGGGNDATAGNDVNTPPPDDGGTTTEAGSDATTTTDGSTGTDGGVPIQIGNCQTFTACGGNVTGTWDYTGGCVADPFANSQCQTLVVHSQSASTKGTITFANDGGTSGTVTRNVQATYNASITIPAACTYQQTCTAIAAYLQNSAPGSTVTCTTNSQQGCDCDYAAVLTDTGTRPYTIQGNNLLVGQGAPNQIDHYAYCVQNASMQYQHTQGPTPETGIYNLTHQ